MNRNRAFLIIFIFSIFTLHAEAPELRNVMPNSWRKVTRLTANEEQAFRRENSTIFARITESMKNNDSGGDNFFIYRQNAGRDIFYRILCTDNSSPNFLSPNIRFSQLLIYRNSWIMGCPYNSIQVWQRFTRVNFYSIDIIEGREGAKGILVTSLFVLKNIDNHAEWSRDAYRKNQLHGQTGSEYYPMAEVNRMVNREEYATLRITASDCLVDPNNPLRYSLQNAFDGDPSTSYVENTEDDLINIDLMYANYEEIIQIAIINGYAQNRDLYTRNNRVREIIAETYQMNRARTELEKILLGRWSCEDNMLSYQFFNIEAPSELKISSVFRGTAYNDTCIAELNFRTNNGWLFGDIDE